METKYFVNVKWQRQKDFTYELYNRNHQIVFSGNQTLNNSAAPEYLGNADMANPEELLASALASCHMLTFLAVAAKSGYIIESYEDKASAVLGKNEEGRMCVTLIELAPRVLFGGDKRPDEAQLKSLHDKAHRNCFIANSIKTKVNVL